MARFTGSSFLITGGTAGIGLATAKMLAGEGATLLVTGHSPDHIDTARAALPDATVIANDAADRDSVGDLVEAARELAPDGLTGAFLNAGIGTYAGIEDMDAETLEKLWAVDLRAPFLQARALAPVLADNGRLLLIGSGTVGGAREDMAAYSMMKAAIRQLTRALATHFAPRGICVNTLTPGATDTGFHGRGGMSEQEIADYHDRVANAVPLGRIGQPEDIAKAACFLLSEDAAYITGTELRVDGGLTMA